MRCEFTVTAGQHPERIDIFLSRAIENASRSKVRQAIDADKVWVNGEGTKASYLIRPGDIIVIEFPRSEKRPAESEDIPLDIVYEDDDLLVINKPAGMTVHPGHGNYSGTLVNALLHHCNKLANDDDAIRPGIVHRIDKNTSGLLVAAKNDHAHRFLANQFKNKTTTREYWAVVWGTFLKRSGTIEGDIARNPKDRKKFAVLPGGKAARTDFEVLEEFDFATLVKCILHTGRTHQIRVHFAHINHPVFGDGTYGGCNIVYGGTESRHRQRVDNLLETMPRQALHARTLGFLHPTLKKRMEFQAELPKDFSTLLTKLRRSSREH